MPTNHAIMHDWMYAQRKLMNEEDNENPVQKGMRQWLERVDDGFTKNLQKGLDKVWKKSFGENSRIYGQPPENVSYTYPDSATAIPPPFNPVIPPSDLASQPYISPYKAYQYESTDYGKLGSTAELEKVFVRVLKENAGADDVTIRYNYDRMSWTILAMKTGRVVQVELDLMEVVRNARVTLSMLVSRVREGFEAEVQMKDVGSIKAPYAETPKIEPILVPVKKTRDVVRRKMDI